MCILLVVKKNLDKWIKNKPKNQVLLIRLSFFIPEESFTDCCELCKVESSISKIILRFSEIQFHCLLTRLYQTQKSKLPSLQLWIVQYLTIYCPFQVYNRSSSCNCSNNINLRTILSGVSGSTGLNFPTRSTLLEM